MKDHLLPRPVKLLLRLFRTDVVKQQHKAIAKLRSSTTDVARIQMVKVNAKWMREFIAYDPMPVLRSVSVPLLAITGSKDVQVDPDDLAAVAAVAPAATVHVIRNVDHILREEPAAVSNPRLYRKQLSRAIDPRVTDRLLSWLAQRV